LFKVKEDSTAPVVNFPIRVWRWPSGFLFFLFFSTFDLPVEDPLDDFEDKFAE
jgi:hypothetical protein